MSESSGNESSRKKPRKQAALASGRGSRATTPLPGAGPSQPQRPRMAAGFTSDGDGTAGEMSDGPSLKKKIKIVGAAAGAKESPAGSRAGSPVPSAGAPAAAQLAPGQRESRIIRLCCIFLFIYLC